MGAENSPNDRDDGDYKYTDCEVIDFETVLLSPALELLASLKLGDRLAVHVTREDGAPTVDVSQRGTRLGSVSHTHVPRLIICIEDANVYFAEVVKLNGAECRVRIHHQNRS